MSDDAERYGPQNDDAFEEDLKRELRAEGSQKNPPKPTGNVCRFCVPLYLKTPSGRRLCHSRFCVDKPGEPIHTTEYAKGRMFLPRRRW